MYCVTPHATPPDILHVTLTSWSQVRYAILDEADQMLDMGFEEDMENILGNVPEGRQTLLFSATLPKWVNKVARRFQVCGEFVMCV